MSTEGSLKSRFNKLDTDRSAVLERARQCAELTVPSLLPPSGHSESSQLVTPYQSMGARGVIHLSSKLLLALLPPNSPFFRMAIDESALSSDIPMSEVQTAMAKLEKAVMMDIESNAMRVPMFEALKLMVGTGNALVYLPNNGPMKTFRLDQYVVVRDPMGNVLEIIIKECVSPDVLPPEVAALATAANTMGSKRTVEVYTHVFFANNFWHVQQEVGGVIVPNSIGKYPHNLCPWKVLRWSAISNEDYGRGQVEQYLGDLRSYESLSASIVEGAAAAAKVLFLISPNGVTSAKDLAETDNGGFATGRADDVSTLQLEKYNDFRVALETAGGIEKRLSYAFLLNASVQRQAERVTAEEVRYMANELEDALGGVYSLLAAELQVWMVERELSRLTKQRKIPSLPKGVFKPVITTGLEALGRGHDMMKLDEFLAGLMNMPEALQYLNVGEYIRRRGTAIGIDMEGLIRSDEEIEAQRQQAQQMEMMQSGPAQELMKGVMNGEGNPGEQPQG